MAITLLNHNIRPYADLEAMLATSHKAMVVAATGAGKTSVALTAPTNEFVGAVRYAAKKIDWSQIKVPTPFDDVPLPSNN